MRIKEGVNLNKFNYNYFRISENDLEKLENFASYFHEKYGLSLSEVIKRFEKKGLEVPISVFQTNKLSAFEAIVRYLRENEKITNKKIAEVTNRKENTISTTYKNSLKKFPSELNVLSKFSFPISKLQNRKLSVLEHLCYHLHKEYKLSFREISVLINRDNRTIWTVVNRARKKLGKVMR